MVVSQGQTIDTIPPEVLIDCAQLVKNNSIQGATPVFIFPPLTLCSTYPHLRIGIMVDVPCVFSGCKMNNINVVYTPWANLKKTGDMDVGQIGFHRQKDVSECQPT